MTIIVIGNGGHSKVIQEIIALSEKHKLKAILDDKQEKKSESNGVVYGTISMIHQLLDKETKVIIAIGNNATRKKVAESLNLNPDRYISLIHPAAVISATAKIGRGTVIMPNAVVNAEATVGQHCIINTGAVIEHEVQLSDYVHVSPNASLTGNVKVGEGTQVGASAAVIPGIQIGCWSVIGAGAAVVSPIPSHCTAVGLPAKVVKKFSETKA